MMKLEKLYMYNEYTSEGDLLELIAHLYFVVGYEKEELIGMKLDVAYPEPIIDQKITKHDIFDWLNYKFEERWDEEGKKLDEVVKIFEKHLHYDDLNEELKKIELYYPRETYTITEQDFKEFEEEYRNELNAE